MGYETAGLQVNNSHYGNAPTLYWECSAAALVVVTTYGIAGTYLVINDDVAGFQTNNDLVVNITGYGYLAGNWKYYGE